MGCPLDATSSFRGGTRFAPESIRKASWTLETYSPYLKLDLDDMSFHDAGNLELRQGDLEYSLELIERAVTEIAEEGRKILLLGGEHLITYPILKAVIEPFRSCSDSTFRRPLRPQGRIRGAGALSRHGHETGERLGGSEIFQIGVRSGTRREFEELLPIDSPKLLASRLSRNMPVYVTFDMDVFDPSLVPGVTTPEPGGLTFKDVMEVFLCSLRHEHHRRRHSRTISRL